MMTIRIRTKLEELCLKDIQSKIEVEARDIGLQSKAECQFEASS